ncbi:Eukaryotic translation initiation factor 3 subunit F [Temnothorax longispinosus]|uniref:Eukaryotic translation initiation factor 3 subunit F n=1 Tax=Temnothorax longispinosus TaxID=300112 RepID=A0A4S2KEC5_9HYME|nr:Eukaryotic translation initiation factor 3 subunit F [Temnothorax longispinosus]
MTILSKKKANAPKDRTREGGAGPEVDVHHGVVQNEHSSGNIALPNSPYQTQVPSHAQASGKSAGGIEPMMDLAQVSEACSKLSLMLEQVLAYVDDVLAGKQLPDNQVGRALLDMVHSVPKMTSDQFDDMFNSNVKDLLMVVALSQLIKTQLQLNEKLTLLTTL